MIANKISKWEKQCGRLLTVREILSAAPKWVVFTFFCYNSDPRPWLNMGLWYDVNREEANERILWRLPDDIIYKIIEFMPHVRYEEKQSALFGNMVLQDIRFGRGPDSPLFVAIWRPLTHYRNEPMSPVAIPYGSRYVS
jgi:hypothetical protein